MIPTVDLDETAGRTPGAAEAPPRRLLPAVLLAATLLGMACATGVQAASRTTPPPPTPRVVTTVAVRTALLDPTPVALLEVTVNNRDTVPVTVREIGVGGVGVAGTSRTPSGRGLAAGQGRTFEVRVPLDCSGTDAAVPPDVAVTVTAPGRVTTAAVAAPSGRSINEGLCATAASTLPAGWRHPVLSRGVRAEGDRASVLVAGLPSGTVGLAAVRAGTLWLPVLASRVAPDGTGSLTLGPPVADCRTLPSGATLPAGLAVLTRDGTSRPPEVYVPVGPDLSRWLLALWRTACPQRPEFVGDASAVPTGIDIHAND